MQSIEAEIAGWREFLQERGHFTPEQLAELEAHLRDTMAELEGGGLATDEAFLIAVRRVGNLHALAAEYARVHTDQVWKQVLDDPSEVDGGKGRRRKYLELAGLALLAGVLGKVPALFGFSFERDEDVLRYFINAGFFLILPISWLFLRWRPERARGRAWAVGATYLVACVAVNLFVYPPDSPAHTRVLTGLHLPILLWGLAGILYAGTAWRDVKGRMDFVRFSGETFIYTVLILCGMGVMFGLIGGLFGMIGVEVGPLLVNWVVVFGSCAAPVIGAFFAQEKRAIVENMAPVLARIFAPLFTVVLAVYLTTLAVRRTAPLADREFLIVFDLMLVLVLGLVLYLVSARRERAPAGLFDYVALALVVLALVADTVALGAIASRLASFGVSPNKVAALGENVLLFVHLAGLAWCYTQFLRGRRGFEGVMSWLTRYLPAYVVWAAIVALGFPVMFGFQ